MSMTTGPAVCNYLRKAELLFELRVRDQPLPGAADCATLRTLLKSKLDQPILTVQFSPDETLLYVDQLTDSVGELFDLIAELGPLPTIKQIDRLDTRIEHLFLEIACLRKSKLTEEQGAAIDFAEIDLVRHQTMMSAFRDPVLDPGISNVNAIGPGVNNQQAGCNPQLRSPGHSPSQVEGNVGMVRNNDVGINNNNNRDSSLPQKFALFLIPLRA